MNKVDASDIHAKLGHPGESYVRASCKNLNLTLKGPIPKCSSCSIAKIKQKNIRKHDEHRATEKGETLYMDISHVSGHSSSGGAKYWLLVVDRQKLEF